MSNLESPIKFEQNPDTNVISVITDENWLLGTIQYASLKDFNRMRLSGEVKDKLELAQDELGNLLSKDEFRRFSVELSDEVDSALVCNFFQMLLPLDYTAEDITAMKSNNPNFLIGQD